MSISWYCSYKSPLGNFLLTFTDEALSGLTACATEQLPPCNPGSSAAARKTVAWLDNYFAGKQTDPHELVINPAGTPFQKNVWKLAAEIPWGQCRTYGDLTGKIASEREDGKMSPRAVGAALARNPIWIVIPCHRIIKKNGCVGGYAGGAELKKKLLQLEGVEVRP